MEQTKMTLLEAYKFTFDKIYELRDEGIEVVIKPSRSRDIKSTVDKYSTKPDGLLLDKWFYVTFFIRDQTEADKVFEMSKYLSLAGIGFDTGGCCGQRDWEIDWSFQCYDKLDEEAIESKEQVEDMINEFCVLKTDEEEKTENKHQIDLN